MLGTEIWNGFRFLVNVAKHCILMLGIVGLACDLKMEEDDLRETIMKNYNHKPDVRERFWVFLLPVLFVTLWFVGGRALLVHPASSLNALPYVQNLESQFGSLQSPFAPTDDALLAVYVLAYDNGRNSTLTMNLTNVYTDTVQGIVSATEGMAGVTAIILADLDQYGDTHILVAQNGTAVPIAELPDTSGTLNPEISEYDTADGATLGGFLMWARETYPADKTILSYVGHGAPLAPVSYPPIAEILADPNTDTRAPTAFTLPFRIGANPDFTDHHAEDLNDTYSHLLSPHDLALALSMGTANGTDPIEVIDLVHCFAASIEELYEVAPYAAMTVAAPNYAFFDPAMPGTALSDIDPAMPPVEMANSIMANYFATIPPNEHPHVLVSVDNSQIPAIKTQWDALATALMDSFANNATATATGLQAAYQYTGLNNGLYDTTFCEETPDYALAAPDALADIGGFSFALQLQFGILSNVGTAAQDVINALNQAINAKSNQNGQPWWDPDPDDWSFNGAYGIAVFAPFQPMVIDGTPFQAWQSLWYTDTTLIAEDVTIGSDVVNIENPYPYSFIARVGDSATWADVLDTYWRQSNTHPGIDIATGLCLPEIREIEEMDVRLTGGDLTDSIQAGTSLEYMLTVTNKTNLVGTNVRLTDTLPAELTFTAVSSSFSACQYNDGLVTCNWPNLEPHQTVTAVISADIPLAVEGLIANHAEVTVDDETRVYDNRHTEETNITTAWTLGLQTSASADQGVEGDVVMYTAVIENTGIGDISNAILTRLWTSRLALAGPITIEPANMGQPGTGSDLAIIPALAPGEVVTVTFPLQLLDGPANASGSVSLLSSEVDDAVISAVLMRIINQAPIALDDAYSVLQGGVLSVPAPGLLSNDSDVPDDTLFALSGDGPAHGTLLLQNDGSFTYMPEAGYTGPDSFVYVATDEDGGTSSGIVTIEVLHVLYLPALFAEH